MQIYKQIDGIDLTLDVDLPTTKGPFPTVIYIHGGGWASGTERQFKPFAGRLKRLGIAGVRINYRKIPQGATFEKTISDCFDAVQWVRDHAKDFNFDLTRLALAGGSAGGHLAALVSQKTPECIAYIGCNPCLDLIEREESSFPGEETLKTFLGETTEHLRKASPIHNLREDPPATLILHGDADTTIDHRTALRYAKALRGKGTEVQIHIFPGEKHGFFNASNPAAYEKCYSLIEAFLKHVFKKQKV